MAAVPQASGAGPVQAKQPMTATAGASASGPSPALQTAAKAADAPVAPSSGPPVFVVTPMETKQHYLKALIYGEYGVGKTRLVGTSAQVQTMRDVLLISAESGSLTLDDDVPEFGLIDEVRTENYKQVGRVFDFLKAHCSIRDRTGPDADAKLLSLQQKVMPDMPSGTRVRRYRTVIIDSLTEVESFCMSQLLGVTELTKLDEESNPAEWGEYRKQHMMIQRLIRNFRDLPMHVLFTCARAYQTDEMKRQIFAPMMTGKLAGQVQGFMDLVGYLILGSPKEDGTPPDRRLIIQPSPRYAAKSRFSRYKKPHFDNPTIGSILKDVGLLDAVTPQS